jgi:hypothetical protein
MSVPEKRYDAGRHLAPAPEPRKAFASFDADPRFHPSPQRRCPLYNHHLHMRLSAGFAGNGDASQMPFLWVESRFAIAIPSLQASFDDAACKSMDRSVSYIRRAK